MIVYKIDACVESAVGSVVFEKPFVKAVNLEIIYEAMSTRFQTAVFQ